MHKKAASMQIRKTKGSSSKPDCGRDPAIPTTFGEILLWVGIAIITLPVLQGWQWIALISPVFVTLLLTRVSGVPLLENKSDKKWGGQEDYEAYKKKTPVLIPRL